MTNNPMFLIDISAVLTAKTKIVINNAAFMINNAKFMIDKTGKMTDKTEKMIDNSGKMIDKSLGDWDWGKSLSNAAKEVRKN